MMIKYLPGLASLFCYSIFGLITKDLYKYSIDGHVMFFYISIFSFLYFLSNALIQNKFNLVETFKADKKDILLSILCVGLLGIFVCDITSILSFKYIDTGVQRAVTFSSAVYIIMMEVLFYKRKIDTPTLVLSIGMIISLLLIAGNINFSSGLKYSLLGLLFAFISAFSYAIYSLIIEKHPVKISNAKVWTYAYIMSIICSFICIVLTGKLDQMDVFHNKTVIIEIILSSIICSGLAGDFMLRSIKSIGGVKTNAILATVPISTLVIGFFCLGETITMWQFLGFVMLIITTIKIK